MNATIKVRVIYLMSVAWFKLHLFTTFEITQNLRQKTPLKPASVSAWTSENSVWIRRNCYLKLFLRNTQKSLSGFRSAHVEFALPEWIFTFQLKEDIKIDSALWTKLLMYCVLVVPSRTNEGHRKIIHKKRATTHSSLRLVHVERYCCEQLCLFQL